MIKDFEKLSRSISNSSGFPLQLRIAQVANSSSNWRVLVEEHPWSLENSGGNGFIDLVLVEINTHLEKRMVVECKRVRDTAWVFLVPKIPAEKTAHIRVWFSNHPNSKWETFYWTDHYAGPASYESKFCAIQGQEQGRGKLLDRMGVELIEATEALAWEEKKLQKSTGNQGSSFTCFYIPVLVTTAELSVASFNPGDVSLRDGSLPKDTSFEKVPYIRFRKSLTNKPSSPPPKSLRDVYSASERSFFIVNSEFFQEFLRNLDLK